MIISGYNPAQQVKPSSPYKLPFNELYQGLAAKQNYYDLMASKADKAIEGLEGLMKNVDIWDSGKAATKVLNFQNNLDSLKEKYPDFTDPMFKRELDKLVRTETTDRWWTDAMAAKPIYEQWRKAYGESDAPDANKATAKSLIEQASMAPEGATSLFGNKISTIAIPKYSDYGKTIYDIGAGVKADANETVNIGGVLITKDKWEGVTQEKLFNALGVTLKFKQDANGNYLDANGNIITVDKQGNFSAQPVSEVASINPVLGAEDMRQLQLEAAYLAKSNPGVSQEDIAKQLYLEKVSGAASAYTYEKTGQDKSYNPLYLKQVDFSYKMQEKAMEEKEAAATEAQTLTYGNSSGALLPEEFPLPTRPVTPNKFLSFISGGLAGQVIAKMAGWDKKNIQTYSAYKEYADALIKAEDANEKAMGKILTDIMGSIPNVENLSGDALDKAIDARYQSYREHFKENSIIVHQFSDQDTVEEETDRWIGTTSGTGDNKGYAPGLITGKAIRILDPETGASEPMSFEAFLDEVGTTPEHFGSSTTANGRVDPVNDFGPSGMKATYQGANGKTYHIVISDASYTDAKNNEPLNVLSKPNFVVATGNTSDATASEPVTVNSLRLTKQGAEYLGLNSSDILVSKRVDSFDANGNYTGEVFMFKKQNGKLVPYTTTDTVDGKPAHITFNDFATIYQQIAK